MKKILKLLIIGVIFLLFGSVSQTQAASYHYINPSDWHSQAYGGGLASSVGSYLDSVGSKKNNIDLNYVRSLVFNSIYNNGGWNNSDGTLSDAERANIGKSLWGSLAYFSGSHLIVGCGNSDILSFDIIVCIPDNTPPALSATRSKDGWQKYIGKITLNTDATDYAKYIWDDDKNCVSKGINFTNGIKIDNAGEGKHTLYLCAKSKAKNECSSPQENTWKGNYWLDPEKEKCDRNTLPNNWENKKFKITKEDGITTNKFTYNGPVCGYKCIDGYELDDKGTLTNSDDECILSQKCDANTKPTHNNNMIINGEENGSIPYTITGEKCNYTCETGYSLNNNNTPTISNDDFCEIIESKCDLNSKPSDSNMEFSGENDSSNGTIKYSYGASICGYVCKRGSLDDKGTADSSDDVCRGSSVCTNPGKPNAFTNDTMNYNPANCTYSCKNNKIYNTHQTKTISDDTCDSNGGDYCNSSTEPVNKNYMTVIQNANSVNQSFKYNSENCGYKCSTGYKLNKHGTEKTSDDTCDYDTYNNCKQGVITDQCPCTLDMNKSLKVCQPATEPGEDKTLDPDDPTTEPGEIGIMDKNLLADIYKYRVVIPVGENESPISYMEYQIELENGNMSEVRTSNDMSFTWKMRKVDNDRLSDGSREYTFRLLKICDEAGNCRNVNKDYIHKVFANTISFSTKNISIDSNGVADGASNKTIIKLLGKYHNQIVPASGINRTIDFNFSSINTVNQDQYINERNAIFVTNANKNDYANRIVLSNSEILNQLNDQKSTNGQYDFDLKVYAPTNEQNKFIMNNLSFDINGELGNRQNINLSGRTQFDFMPLYETKFGSEFEKLVSTFTQTGTIELERNNISGVNLYLKESKNIVLTRDAIDTDKKYSFDLVYNISGKKLSTLFNFIDRGDNYLSDFKTIYLQSGVKYNNDGKNIKYKSDKTGGDNKIINGVKVLGKTNTNKNKQRDILENQNTKDIHNLAGKIDKATLKKNIKRNAFKLIKGMNSGTELNGIKYIECSDGDIKTLNDYQGTYILKGCNAYINHNIKIGGIIVLKNSNGKGGKLYIAPNVTKIEAAIYVDKSILGYKNGELSSNTSYDLLKNQLYIYGVVFSENTIGGSLKTPPVCPYYVSSCTQEEAQKYDLNFLRSGYENRTVNEEFPVIIKYNPSIQTNPPIGFSE